MIISPAVVSFQKNGHCLLAQPILLATIKNEPLYKTLKGRVCKVTHNFLGVNLIECMENPRKVLLHLASLVCHSVHHSPSHLEAWEGRESYTYLLPCSPATAMQDLEIVHKTHLQINMLRTRFLVLMVEIACCCYLYSGKRTVHLLNGALFLHTGVTASHPVWHPCRKDREVAMCSLFLMHMPYAPGAHGNKVSTMCYCAKSGECKLFKQLDPSIVAHVAGNIIIFPS